MAVDHVEEKYRQARIDHWDATAQKKDRWSGFRNYYRKRLVQVYRFLIPPGQKVLEIGCAQGDLLAALQPSEGVGVDFSSEMIERASNQYPGLRFIQADAHTLELDEKFDTIILSDLVNDLWDVQAVFEKVTTLAAPRTRIILNFYSRLWEFPLAVAEWMGFAKPTLHQNWLTEEDIINLLNLTGLDVLRNWPEFLSPFPLGAIGDFFNKFLVRLWPFNILALTHFVVARPRQRCPESPEQPKVSVIVPARNEEGNIQRIIEQVPEIGGGTELIFVEGHSSDNTYQAILEAVENHPERNCKVFQQTGVGKSDAVRLGFKNATGEVLMILDADLTVPPNDLIRFYDVLTSGRGEFVNGVRLVYPMEDEAMRYLNLLGNKFFVLIFSWLIGQPVKDTLCGTKVLWKEDYERIAANREYFGDFDPFGDFDLLLGAAKLNLKIVDLPVRYRQRTYGTTNIQRWKHGWYLLQMVFFAARRIKFI